ncbi:MAG TPA: aminotransferase class IV [Prolixibacteraceae bacterium]|nr:aminotransferase class IV [Prolixibacteraceae bacterium]
MDFLIVNGEVIATNSFKRAPFCQNSFTLCKKTWFGYGGIPLLNENVDNLLQLIDELGLPVPAILENKRELHRIVKRMLNKNKFYRSGLIRFEIFWENNTAHCVITSQSFLHFDFALNEQGTLVNFSRHKILSANHFNRYAFYHSTNWQISAMDLTNSKFKNSIILNEKDGVCECINSNIFMIKGKTLITPSLLSGCFESSIRTPILKLAGELGLKVHEQTFIKTGELQEMDEIFLAGEETGFQWLIGIENKRYIHQYIDVLHKEFNDKLKGKAI